MTDFESNNLHPAVSLDHLSLRNWKLQPEKMKKTEEKSEEKSEKSPAQDSDDDKEEVGIITLVPQFVRGACKNPNTAELKVSYDAPTAQYTYTYSITWEDEEDGSEEELIKILKEAESKSKLKSMSATKSVSGSGTDSTSESTSESVTKTTKKTSSLFTPPLAPVDTKCDGPCKKIFPSNLLSTIGRCGHYLCTACYGIVKNSDGTNGCSSASCFWRGASREESKKNYDEDVRRKQRAKAKEMVRIGIDVKPASRVNSAMSSTNTSPKSRNSSKTNLTSLVRTPQHTAPATMIPSLSEPPPKSETWLRAHLIIVEPSKLYGMTHVYSNHKFRADANLLEAIKEMLVKKQKKVMNYIPAGKVYYGMTRGPAKFGMRRIKDDKIPTLVVGDIPKLGKRLVLIMDMNDYVTRGVKIYLE